ncbi:plasmid replication protein (plasmid) [Metabacillus halosaccharovorans]|uniref:plasmid replication protein n=1 Tax=Metabacillus halosaccharovorans TaxID=930124 RepID=UPI00203F3C51|nr:plasmid replication protein [Metabacillus halosaccharovorans]MCM3441365.1 plasmid replication protein [Metabacillus halosaccharovorans]
MTITVNQQNLLERSDINFSLKFGYLGLGMGGCSIAAECANLKTNVKNGHFPYNGLLINTNNMDFEKINVINPNIEKLQIGNGKGAGRDIEVGEQAFIDNQDEIISVIKKQFSDRDFIWIVAGLGGGTGTGSVIESIKSLHNNGFKKKFGLILTLPRNKEGSTVISNALERLQRISKAMQGLGSIILVDNQKLYDKFIKENPESSLADYLKFSNTFVAETLHELNVVTASFKPYGDSHFDSSEFENLIKTPGILSLSKYSVKDSKIDLANESSYVPEFTDSINNGTLSDGYNLENATRAAASVIANKPTAQRVFTLSFTDKIENIIDDKSPLAGEKPIATYIDDKAKGVHFYTVFAGLKLPKRINELVVENNRLSALLEEKDEEDDVLASLQTFKRKKKQEDDFDDLDSLLDSNNNDDELDFGDTKSKQEEYDPINDL